MNTNKNITYGIYRLDRGVMENVIDADYFEKSVGYCKRIFEALQEESEQMATVYPIIRFKNDVEYDGVVGVIRVIASNDEVFGAMLDTRPSTINEYDEKCAAMYELEIEPEFTYDDLKEIIEEYGLYYDVLDFVAGKILGELYNGLL